MLEAILQAAPALLAGVPPLILLFFVLAFVAGIATIPLIAYGVGDLLPGFIAEPLANALLVLAFLGMDNPTLHQTETGEYEFVEGDPDSDPDEYWTRFAWSRFGITAAMTEAAWQTLATDASEIETDAVTDLPDDYAKVSSLSRGGKQWVTQLGARSNSEFALPIGQVLSVFQNSAGLDLGVDAQAQGEKEHGGDTSSFSPKMRLMGAVLFTSIGIAMGGFIFFL